MTAVEEHRPLSRDLIVDTALAITHAEGLAKVTMRAVGSRLGVTPMALYRHVADRETLVRLVADRVGALVRPDPSPSLGWRERSASWASSQRTILRQHQGVAAWLIDNGPAGPEAYRLLEYLAAGFAEAGFSDARVARSTTFVMSWTFSRIAIEDAADARKKASRPSRAAAYVGGLDDIDPDVHPTATRVGREFFTLRLDDVFREGLEVVLRGIGED